MNVSNSNTGDKRPIPIFFVSLSSKMEANGVQSKVHQFYMMFQDETHCEQKCFSKREASDKTEGKSNDFCLLSVQQ